jgi:hypothetical protein
MPAPLKKSPARLAPAGLFVDRLAAGGGQCSSGFD